MKIHPSHQHTTVEVETTPAALTEPERNVVTRNAASRQPNRAICSVCSKPFEAADQMLAARLGHTMCRVCDEFQIIDEVVEDFIEAYASH